MSLKSHGMHSEIEEELIEDNLKVVKAFFKKVFVERNLLIFDLFIVRYNKYFTIRTFCLSKLNLYHIT